MTSTHNAVPGRVRTAGGTTPFIEGTVSVAELPGRAEIARCAATATRRVSGVNCRGLIPARPRRRSEAATVLRGTRVPAPRRSARMRGAP